MHCKEKVYSDWVQLVNISISFSKSFGSSPKLVGIFPVSRHRNLSTLFETHHLRESSFKFQLTLTLSPVEQHRHFAIARANPRLTEGPQLLTERGPGSPVALILVRGSVQPERPSRPSCAGPIPLTEKRDYRPFSRKLQNFWARAFGSTTLSS